MISDDLLHLLEDEDEFSDEEEELLEDYQLLDFQVGPSGEGDQWVTFKLGAEVYGLDIHKVEELIGFQSITLLPNMPSFFKGMLNLRGMIIPVIDLRLKFGLPGKDYHSYTVIIIVQVEEKLMGIVVDSVSDVLFLPREQVQSVEDFSSGINTDYVLGIGQHQEDLVLLLDIERILSKEEFEIILQAPSTALKKEMENNE